MAWKSLLIFLLGNVSASIITVWNCCWKNSFSHFYLDIWSAPIITTRNICFKKVILIFLPRNLKCAPIITTKNCCLKNVILILLLESVKCPYNQCMRYFLKSQIDTFTRKFEVLVYIPHEWDNCIKRVVLMFLLGNLKCPYNHHMKFLLTLFKDTGLLWRIGLLG